MTDLDTLVDALEEAVRCYPERESGVEVKGVARKRLLAYVRGVERERDEKAENLRFHECCTPALLLNEVGHAVKTHDPFCSLLLARIEAQEARREQERAEAAESEAASLRAVVERVQKIATDIDEHPCDGRAYSNCSGSCQWQAREIIDVCEAALARRDGGEA